MAIALALVGFGAAFMLFYGAGLPFMPPDDGDRASVGVAAGGVAAAAIGAWAGWYTVDRSAPGTEVPIRLDFAHSTVSVTTNGHPGPRSATLVRTGELPRRPVGFQPRDGLVAELARTAADHRLAVVRTVTGTRGVGKTQLAAAYARSRVEDAWPVVAWINGETRGQLVSGLAELAAQLGVRESGEDAETSARAALSWIGRTDERCLLVVDNAVDPDEVADWLPTSGRAEVVVTTTSRAFGNIAVGGQVDVGVFTQPEALAFLHERTGLDDPEGARALAEELGRLPVALAQSAAVIKNENIGYRGCLERLRSVPVARLLAAVPGERYPHRMAEAVLLSVQQVEQRDDTGLVRVLLDALGLLAPSGVAVPLLQAVAGRHRPGACRADVERALGLLVEASLATWVGSDSVALHRLTQRVVRDRSRAEEALGEMAGVVGECLDDERIPLREAWERREEGHQLADQVDGLWNAVADDLAALGEERTTLLTGLRGWMSRYLLLVGESARALDAAEETLLCLSTGLETESGALLTALATLADIRDRTGRSEGAVGPLDRLLTIVERSNGPDHEETLAVRRDLAHAHRAAGHFDLAVSHFEHLVSDVERLRGPDHSDTIEAQSDLARTYRAAGRLAEAVAISEAVRERLLPTSGSALSRDFGGLSRLVDFYDSAGRAAEGAELLRGLLAEQESGPDHDPAETMWTRTRLADNCMSAGLYDESLEVARRALEDAERLLADAPRSLASVRVTWANALAQFERYDEALAQFRRNVDDLTALHGPDHPHVLDAREWVVHGLRNALRHGEAREQAAELLADYERLLGSDDTDTLRARSVYADACEEAGHHPEAIEVARRVVRESERIYGPGHPWTLGARIDLAVGLRGALSYEEAETLVRRTREEAVYSLGARHALVLRADELLADVLLRMNRGEEARELRERTLEERIARYGAAAEDGPWGATLLADVEIWLGDYERGIARYREAMTTLDRRHGTDHRYTIVVRRRLAGAYARTSRFPEWVEAITRSVDDYTRFYGADHPWTLLARSEQIDAVRRRGKRREALRMRRALYAEFARVLGERHRNTIGVLDDLADDYRAVNRRFKALSVRRRVLALQMAETGPDSTQSRYALRGLGGSYWSVGFVWKFATVQRRLLEQALHLYGPDHPHTLTQLRWRAASLRATGRIRQCLDMHRARVESMVRLYGPDHDETLNARGSEARALRLTGRVRKAVVASAGLVADSTRVYGLDHPRTWYRRIAHAYAVLWSGHPRRAFALCQEVLLDGGRILGPDHPDIRRLVRRFTLLSLATGHRRVTPQGVTTSPGHPRQ